MGFININGQVVHTSALSGTTTISGTSIGVSTITGTSSTSTSKINTWSSYGNVSIGSTVVTTKYHVLGEDVEVKSSKDYNTAQNIALINLFGKQYYDEIKKQGISFPVEIEEFLSKKFLIIERDRKINDIINTEENL
jgi:hypothetical protein